MQFHTSGDPQKPPMLLIHGVLTPWQIWEPIAAHFAADYRIIIPALDAHTAEAPSEFVSIAAEADAIAQYMQRECGGSAAVICGLSMGGAIAYDIFARGLLKTGTLVLDGAPLTGMPAIARIVMTQSYLSLIRKSKKRDPKIMQRFAKDFLPAEYIPFYLDFVDKMSEDSIRNMIRSVCGFRFAPAENQNGTRILFLHGDRGNEAAAVRSAALMKQHYPETEDRNYPGLLHTELMTRQPARWCSEVEGFLKQSRR